MKKVDLLDNLAAAPVIAAVKSEEGLLKALESECEAVFTLYGSVVDIASIIGRVTGAGKAAFVHIDLIDGLSAREAAVDFICGATGADGIISTKPSLVKYAKAKNLITVQRFFILDSLALQSFEKQSGQDYADFLEILPGVMPKVIRPLVKQSRKPIIASGLIMDKEDVINALGAGAAAVSSTNPKVWLY